MENARSNILKRLYNTNRVETERPEIRCCAVEGDPVRNFTAKLRGFDGRTILFDSKADAIAWLDGSINRQKQTVYSAIKEYSSSVDFSDPHAANIVDVCIAEGLLGVGETGSVWVTNESLGLTAAALFSTDLYLLLDSSNIVNDIMSAYEKIDIRATQYGAFYSGPSATADIEAIHITGAQSFMSLTVLLY